MNALRAIAGLVVLGLAGLLFYKLFTTERTDAPVGGFQSSRQCQECHAEVYAEWAESQHAHSWINPEVRALSNDFANQDCIDCHAPQPLFALGIGNRVLPRQTRRNEGVDCISCHQIPESEGGGMAATITHSSAACRPVARRELVTVELCVACHDQHQTVQQWKESEWPERGEDCLSCHMPHRNGDPNAPRSHRFWGGKSLDMLQAAVQLRGVREDGRWVAEIENVGAGHAFPTDERSRASDLFWRPAVAVGEEPGAWRHLHRMRSPYRHEVDLDDTLLAAHELRRFPIPAEAAGESIELALFYMRKPYWEDPEAPDPEREATLVHRVMLVP